MKSWTLLLLSLLVASVAGAQSARPGAPGVGAKALPTAPADEMPPAPVIEPAPATVIEVAPKNLDHWDATVFSEPVFSSPIAGHVARGARIPIRGQVQVPKARYCDSNVYYALTPTGFLCADDGVPSTDAPSTADVLQMRDDVPVPYSYAMVKVPEEEQIPMYASVSDVAQYAQPKRMLARGDTIAVEDETINVDGERYRVSIDGGLIPAEHTYKMRKFSEWQGVQLAGDTHFPFAWVSRRKVRVYDAPRGKKVGELTLRARVDILAEEQRGRQRWLRIAEGQYLRGRDVNVVRRMPRPTGTGNHPQWVDVDLGEQVLVAYRDEQPVYATLISSGRPPHHTPRGNYPIWGKASAITMKSQPYDDKPYYVHRVPWVLFFQAHNALHGAYWHDRFGWKKSHGCANLSPRDARYLFEWVEPKLPPGWTALRYTNLDEAPVVHVRNTGYRTPFRQERPIGPPDPEEEARKAEAAEERRLQERIEEEQKLLEQMGVDPNAVPVFGPPPPGAIPTPSADLPTPAPLQPPSGTLPATTR